MAEKNSSIVTAVKGDLVGGAIFLIPGFLAVFVLGKVFNMLRSLAVALGPRLGIAERARRRVAGFGRNRGSCAGVSRWRVWWRAGPPPSGCGPRWIRCCWDRFPATPS